MPSRLKDEVYMGHTIRFYKFKNNNLTPIVGQYDDKEFGQVEITGRTKDEVFDTIKKNIFSPRYSDDEKALQRHMERQAKNGSRLATLSGDDRFLSVYHDDQFSAMLDLNALAWEQDVRVVALIPNTKTLVVWAEGDIYITENASPAVVKKSLRGFDVRELTPLGERLSGRVN